MTKEKIKENLCSYDKQNPDYNSGMEKIEWIDPCYCDNCFYGRSKLASELLKVDQLLLNALSRLNCLRL